MIKWFLITSASLLAITGCAKIIPLFGHTLILNIADPIFGIPYRYLLPLIGVLELIIACLCVFTNNPRLNVSLLAWLATCFAAYRISLLMIGYRKPCSCFGNLTDSLHIAPQTAELVMKIILSCLLFGSYSSLFYLWREKRKATLMALTAGKARSSAP